MLNYAWKVTFSSEDEAMENEFQFREGSMANTYTEGCALWIEGDPHEDVQVLNWYGDAERMDVSPEDMDRMFHSDF